MEYITVGELMAILAELDPSDQVFGCGGEDWGAVRVVHHETGYTDEVAMWEKEDPFADEDW